MILYKRKYIGLLVFSFILFSINLRAPLTALPPIVDKIQQSLNMGTTVSGILTTIPVLCFGLFTPFASRLIARIGLEQAMIWTMSGVIIGSIIRVLGDVSFMLIGTIIIGLALTIGNLLGMLIIGRDFKGSANIMTGIMVLGMSLGGMITSSVTSPLEKITNWQIALSSWALLALWCLLLWIRIINHRTHKARRAIDSLAIVKKDRDKKEIHLSGAKKLAVICLMFAFACHCFAFYGIVAWLPKFLVDSGSMTSNEAGVAVSFFHLLGFVGCLGIPMIVKRFKISVNWLFIIVGVAWFLVPTGYYFFPKLWLLWDIMGGIGGGGAYVVIFMLVISNSANLDENRKISTVVQCSGYIIASIAPIVTGALYEYLGGWIVAFTCLAIVTLVFMMNGIIANLFFSKKASS